MSAAQDYDAEHIKTRDDHTCFFCGYKSRDNIVHHLDHNHSNNGAENLTTICHICHQHQHLEAATDHQHICYLPELKTDDVIHFIRALYTAIKQGNKDAIELLEWLTSHSEYTDLSYTTASAEELADALKKTPPSLQSHIANIFRHIYVVNDLTQIETCHSESTLHNIDSWETLHQQASQIII